MTPLAILRFALEASIFLLVFAMGLRASLADATYLFRRPWKFLKSILSMNVIMLAFAVTLIQLFDLRDATKIALVALALSPVPPILPRKQMNAGGKESFALGLLIATAATAIVLIPAALELLGLLFDLNLRMPVTKVAPIVLATMVVPLAIGMIARHFAPALAERVGGHLLTSAFLLLVLAALPLPVLLWPQLQALIGNGTLLALAMFSLVGVTVGHLLGGPAQEERTVLALATAARHPAMAIAIASVNFPDEKGVLAAVVWHLIVGAVVALLYIRLTQSKQPSAMRD